MNRKLFSAILTLNFNKRFERSEFPDSLLPNYVNLYKQNSLSSFKKSKKTKNLVISKNILP